jgi:hypothetical protein
VPRRRTTVAGEVRSVTSYVQPYQRTEAELVDGTGVVVLRFMGRRRVPGVVPGARLFAMGTPGYELGALVMLNPLYCWRPAE